MSSFGQSFSVHDLPKSESSNDFSPVPAGWYSVQVANSELRITKDGSGKYAAMRLKIEGPTHCNRQIFTNLNVINRNAMAEKIAREQLRKIMEATGLQEFHAAEQLIGLQFDVKVDVRPAGDDKNGIYREATNDVKDYRPTASNTLPQTTQTAPQFGAAATPAPVQQWPRPQSPATTVTPQQQPQKTHAVVAPAAVTPPWGAPSASVAPAAPAFGAAPPWAAQPAL